MILLVAPSNKLYMPYLKNYTNILDEYSIEYKSVVWDRLNLNEVSEYVYKDLKGKHKRGFIDYYEYGKFIKKIIAKENPDRIIVFGLQLYFFLKKELSNKFDNKFIIDIRDYNKIIKITSLKKMNKIAHTIVLSSKGFRSWLLPSDKIFINHNTTIKNIPKTINLNKNKIIYLSYIGTVTRYETNIKIINSLKNSQNIFLSYHGEGPSVENIKKYTDDNRINNVVYSGKYQPNEEKDLYLKSTMINMILDPNSTNNLTSSSNRLYRAAEYGIPLLAFEGTFVGEIIKDYNLGLVISDYNNLNEQINCYLKEFNTEIYENSRMEFLKKTICENEIFTNRFLEFLGFKRG